MTKLTTLSATKIGVWDQCPLYFWFVYVNKEERVPTSVGLLFGSQIHVMLEEFYNKNFRSADTFVGTWKNRWKMAVAGELLRGKDRQSLNVAAHDYTLQNGETIKIKVGDHMSFFSEDIPGSYYKYRNMGMSMLQRFYDRHAAKPAPLAHEKPISFDFRGYPIVGRIDRIDETEKGHFITDYKTDRDAPTTGQLEDSTQLSIYSAGFRETYGKLEAALLFYHLRSGEVFKTTRQEKHFSRLEQKCEDVTAGIVQAQSSGVWLARRDSHCIFCDYKQPCAGYISDPEGLRKVGSAQSTSTLASDRVGLQETS